MTKRIKTNQRLVRLERKCDKLLREIRAIRRCLYIRSGNIDAAIDRMHHNARRMRDAAIKDSGIISKLFNPNSEE